MIMLESIKQSSFLLFFIKGHFLATMTKAICWFIHFSWKNIIGYTPLIGKQNRHKYHSKQSFIGYYCAETYMRASISRRKLIANMMLLRYTATVGDMAQ